MISAAIENVQHIGDVSPGKLLHYNRFMKKARDAAEAGRPKESLEYLVKAAAIQKTDKVLKRIEKVKVRNIIWRVECRLMPSPPSTTRKSF